MDEIAKTAEDPTYVKIETSIAEYEDALRRFEKLLNSYSHGGGPSDEEQDKTEPYVENTWKTTAPRIYSLNKQLHEQIDRLENLFR